MRFATLIKTAVLISLPLALGLTPQATRQFGPYATGSPDTGTCGNFWADDRFDVFFKVDTRRKEDGSYDVVQQFKNGTFVTRSGRAPDSCLVGLENSATIPAGIEGKMQCQFWFRVHDGEYNPNGVPQAPYGPKEFTSAIFGPNAKVEIYDWFANYNADSHGNWRDCSAEKGGLHGSIR